VVFGYSAGGTVLLEMVSVEVAEVREAAGAVSSWCGFRAAGCRCLLFGLLCGSERGSRVLQGIWTTDSGDVR